MKTLLVTNDFPPRVGGIQSYLSGLLSTLDPSGVRVLAPAYPGAEEFDANLPYEVFRWPTLLYPGRRLLGKIQALAAGVDVVQFGFVLQSWVMAPRMLRRTGRPYAVFVHGTEVLMPLRLPGASRLLMWGSLEKASGILSVSAHTATAVKRLTAGRARCTVMRPVAELERFHPSERSRDEVRTRHGLGDRPVILCVSRLTLRKGQDLLIDALPVLGRKYGARLVLVGGGPIEKSLRRRAEKRGVEGDVVFAGRVSDRLLPDYYAAADVFAMPVRSRWIGLEEEGFGVVFVEAAASGLPMVVGGSGGAREAVENEVTGCLVDGSSVEEIRRALDRLLGDEALRKKMGVAARERAVETHGPDVVGERYRRFLRTAAGGTGRAA